MVTSGVEFVDEGGKKYSSCEGGLSLVSSDCSPIVLGRKKPLFTTEMLEFSDIGNPKILTKIGFKPNIDLPGVSENVMTTFSISPLKILVENEPIVDEAFRFER